MYWFKLLRPATENAESTKENEQFLEDILESLEEDSREEVKAIKVYMFFLSPRWCIMVF